MASLYRRDIDEECRIEAGAESEQVICLISAGAFPSQQMTSSIFSCQRADTESEVPFDSRAGKVKCSSESALARNK